ncbi:putative lipoprotein [Photobacterium aphoticum]|uniref:Putative lipoprotein n=1 Tax=Photobacterium aphoticum TaxID=754436 RepID=A0A090QHP2_9GAMM|nr:putative lipoprotein [Photobacterium aphoticum]
MTIYKTVPIIALASLLAACGSDSGSDTTEQRAKVSFSVSDAPVDTASEVVVAFDKIELQHDNGQRYIIDVDEDSQGNDYQQIDLLKYPGTEAAMIITDEELPVGHYKEMIIHTVPGSMNYVEDNGQHALKIPSNKLRLGGFTVESEAVQSFTIEFDLRKALVLRGNENSNNGYNLKPHGVTIIDNSEASSLFGQVDPALFTAGEQCEAEGNVVYLYAGHGHQDATLLDNLDVNDPDFDASTALLESVWHRMLRYRSMKTTTMPLGIYLLGRIPWPSRVMRAWMIRFNTIAIF